MVSTPPANTKLLGLNSVTFNVGTTTASVNDLELYTVTLTTQAISSHIVMYGGHYTIQGDP